MSLRAETQRKKILVVEDDNINMFVLEKMLAPYFEILKAQNGSEALRVAEETDLTYVLLDINLGSHSMDGVEIMKQFRQRFPQSHAKIFAVTCYAKEEDRNYFINVGFDNYFTKPIRKSELLRALGIAPAA